MPPSLRLTITAVARDPRTQALRSAGEQIGITVPDDLGVSDVIHLQAELDEQSRARLTDLLVDPLLQQGTWATPPGHGIEVTPLPGVTDAEATAVLVAARTLGITVEAAVTGRRITFAANTPDEVARRFVERVVANPVVETWTFGPADPPSRHRPMCDTQRNGSRSPRSATRSWPLSQASVASPSTRRSSR